MFKTLITSNFHLAILAQVVGGILVIQKPELIVSEDLSMYGPLRNNLLIMTVYLALMQLILWFTRYTRKGYIEALVMGVFLILAGAGTRFYASVNQLPLENTMLYFGLYAGASHILFYLVHSKPSESL